MKKIKSLSLLLSLILLMQCCLIPAAAAESAETLPAESTPAVTVAAPEELTFGTVSIKKGCRTIEGMEPVGGNDRRLETSQSAFLYEVETDTVVYAYNADAKVLFPGFWNTDDAPAYLTKAFSDIAKIFRV